MAALEYALELRVVGNAIDPDELDYKRSLVIDELNIEKGPGWQSELEEIQVLGAQRLFVLVASRPRGG